jgi:hypothetical protein
VQRIKSESKALDFAFGSLLGPTPVMSPAADTIGGNLGNYARQLNNAQACQLVMYCVEVVGSEGSNAVSKEEQQFVVSRLSHQSDQSDVKLAETLEDQVGRRDLERAADHGYGSGPARHITSLKHCTCQFRQCWGLTCRHQYAVLHQLGNKPELVHCLKVSANVIE